MVHCLNNWHLFYVFLRLVKRCPCSLSDLLIGLSINMGYRIFWVFGFHLEIKLYFEWWIVQHILFGLQMFALYIFLMVLSKQCQTRMIPVYLSVSFCQFILGSFIYVKWRTIQISFTNLFFYWCCHIPCSIFQVCH